MVFSVVTQTYGERNIIKGTGARVFFPCPPTGKILATRQTVRF